MSSAVRVVWENVYGLLVDDGQLAIGIVASLAFVWALVAYAGESAQAWAGWILVALLVALTFANLYRTGHHARHRVAKEG